VHFSELPNINSLLEHKLFYGLSAERVKRAARAYVQGLRDSMLSGSLGAIPSLDECAQHVLSALEADASLSLRGLVNATGVVLHTNLGRAPLGMEIYASAAGVFGGYCNLEYDFNTGQRGSRHSHIEKLICELTGAQAAMIVNNNSAAAMLMLGAMAENKGVAISRGELVEIGGSFRVPEIIEHSGARLIEIGSTNKTHLSDYAKAVKNKGAEVLLKVHASNYEIVGFTKSVSISELAKFGAENDLPVFYNMGSCFLIDPQLIGIRDGETARSAIEAGADLICFSADKLIGSTQAGIIAGRSDYISEMKQHPLARALRPDKVTLSVLESTLKLSLYPEEAIRQIPVLSMLAVRPAELLKRAQALAKGLEQVCPGWIVEVRETLDETGGGSMPNVPLHGFGVILEPVGISSAELEEKLRKERIVTRINGGAVIIAVRTILPGDDEIIADTLSRIFSGSK